MQLSAVLGKPAVDQTGLTEKYDFVVKFTPDPDMMQGLGGGGPAPQIISTLRRIFSRRSNSNWD